MRAQLDYVTSTATKAHNGGEFKLIYIYESLHGDWDLQYIVLKSCTFLDHCLPSVQPCNGHAWNLGACTQQRKLQLVRLILRVNHWMWLDKYSNLAAL